jgi:hypothetical protein
MPKVSEFYGIQIYLYGREHGVPHFHAKYSESEAVFAIDPLGLLQGSLPGRAFGLVMEWAANHQAELMAAWMALQNGRSPAKIEPLK